MAYEKVDAFLKRHAIAVRILVIALILFGILLRIGISHIQEYNRVQQLREQGWYLIGTCNSGNGVFLMFDAQNAAELEQKLLQYEEAWRDLVRLTVQNWRPADGKTVVNILIPDEKIKYGTATQCDHGGYSINLICDTYCDHAVKQIEWVIGE